MINIKIKFSDSWENSFLSGDMYDKTKRGYISSGKSGFENYKDIRLNHKTVLGILYRILGSQKKLSSILEDESHYLKSIDNKIFFEEKLESITEDIVYLRNVSGADDPSGQVQGPKPEEKTELFSDKYFSQVWFPLVSSPTELNDFILSGVKPNNKVAILHDRMEIGNVIKDNIEKNKSYDGKLSYGKIIENSNKLGVDVSGVLNLLVKEGYLSEEDSKNGLSYKILVYCSIYVAIRELRNIAGFSELNLTKTGNISGLSKRTFTPKDFMTAAGKKKKVVGNPSSWSGWIKTESGTNKKQHYFLKRKNGVLNIKINVDSIKGKEILEMIENAGVGPFVVGKKGLAYIDAIWEE